jgi:hypothetical protein
MGNYSIRGQISGAIQSGVIITALDSTAYTTYTDSTGRYAILNLPPGTYTVTPTLTDYSFSPVRQTVAIPPTLTNVNFVATRTYNITGSITYLGSGVPGLVVTASSNTATYFATTNSVGVYTFIGVPNATYTVKPSTTGYTYQPTSTAVIINNADAAGINFTIPVVYTSNSIVPYGKFKAYWPANNSSGATAGTPLIGGKLWTYQASTTTFPSAYAPTYTDIIGDTLCSNPITLDGNGEAAIWSPIPIRLQLYDSLGNLIWDINNVITLSYTKFDNSAYNVIDATPIYLSPTSFSISSSIFQPGMAVQATVTAGTIYGIVKSITTGANQPTINVTWYSGQLDTGLSSVSLSEFSTYIPSQPIIPLQTITGNHVVGILDYNTNILADSTSSNMGSGADATATISLATGNASASPVIATQAAGYPVYQPTGYWFEPYTVTDAGVSAIGSGYVTAPALSFPSASNIDGTVPTGYAILSTDGQGTITEIVVANGAIFYPPGNPGYGGYGYDIGISGGQTVNGIDGSQRGITIVNVVNKGNGYSAPPAVAAVDPQHLGSGFAAYSTITNGQVTGVVITNPGKNYSDTTYITLAGGFNEHTLATVTVNHHGTGYYLQPNISFTDTTNNDIVAQPVCYATIDSTGHLLTITILNSGVMTYSPTVVITPAAFYYTLPDPTTVPNGVWLRIKNNGTGNLILLPHTGNYIVINNVANPIIAPLASNYLFCDGTSWWSR